MPFSAWTMKRVAWWCRSWPWERCYQAMSLLVRPLSACLIVGF